MADTADLVVLGAWYGTGKKGKCVCLCVCGAGGEGGQWCVTLYSQTHLFIYIFYLWMLIHIGNLSELKVALIFTLFLLRCARKSLFFSFYV